MTEGEWIMRPDGRPTKVADSAATGAGDLSELPNYLEELANRFPEINPSNYDHDDACALNSWGCEAHEALREAAASRDALRAKDAEIERLTERLACISRMKVFPDDKTNRFTLAAAITLATNALALKEQDQ